MSTQTPNMNLTVPSSGENSYPSSISSSMTLIDQHDHTAGNGIQIPTGGIADGAVTGVKLNSNVADNSTVEIASNQIRVKDAGITQAKLAPLGQQISSENIGQGIFLGTWTDFANLSVTITTYGRPIFVGLISSTIYPGYFGVVKYVDSISSIRADYRILRGVSDVVAHTFVSTSLLVAPAGNVLLENYVPASSFSAIDVVAAGTYTYKLQAQVDSIFGGGATAWLSYAKLVAFEL